MNRSSARVLGAAGAILALFPVINIVGIPIFYSAVQQLARDIEDSMAKEHAVRALAFSLFAVIASFLMLPLPPLGLLVSWIFWWIAGKNWNEALSRLAQAYDHSIFATAGNFLYLGGLLTLVLVGYLVLVVAFILAATGFLTLPSETPQRTPAG